jgi:DNA-binding winged helix-turn-helix (wHTH) protein
MNLLKRFLLLTPIALILLTSFTSKIMGTTVDETYQMIQFRRIGHEFLLSLGDKTSRVLPVRKIADGEYRLEFEKPFAFMPDSLIKTVEHVIKTNTLESDYLITVIEPANKAVVYGFATRDLKKGLVPCIGRALPQKNYAIIISVLSAPTILSMGGQVFYVSIAGGLLAISLIATLAYLRKRKVSLNAVKSESKSVGSKSIPIGKYLFYPAEKLLVCNEESVELTAKEHKLLSIFTREPNQLIDRNRLLKEGWEDEGVITGRSLDMYVSKLRKKLGKDTSISITNVHGKGYSLNAGIL